MEAASFGRFY